MRQIFRYEVEDTVHSFKPLHAVQAITTGVPTHYLHHWKLHAQSIQPNTQYSLSHDTQ